MGIIYVLARAANAIPKFRYRIPAGGVVEHEIVHPSSTILTDGDLFSFCSFESFEDFKVVAADHALMDGIHMGRFYEMVQDLLNRPDSIFSER